MLLKKFTGNYEEIIAKELEKKKMELVLREKLDIEERIKKLMDDDLEDFKKQYKKKKWKYWK